ncbi:probable ATP-dependent RNA helicase DDX10 [Eurytemora carolleeae]|uniref:probable ATP-dependent RNA helicase DDX10 n=1 Tax=Eurytemora carolleeae TaxID=1294199 RepID=UPI000C78CA36|nr:probable ATP-dependent RNA helicase DDX10 [Eurytemora carolleeae]|eukprot:XP_023348850.1 probable ATP-dependent RNA helicase DDX10 [Eurytemora affinis]
MEKKDKFKNKKFKHKKFSHPKKEEKKKVKKIDTMKENINKLTSRYEEIDTKTIKTFSEFPLSKETLKGLKEAGFDKPTEIQRESIGLALRGLDILGAAKTGSGKTLAFIIPIIEKLYTEQWSRTDGVGALIITPTRELAYQIFEALRKVGKFHAISAGLVIGGKDLKFEWKRLQGCNIVVCTPGRLLQHLDENPAFNMDNLQILVLDEADRCLDLGFQQAMNSIIDGLPAQRQSLLFSATQTRSVTDLARLSLENPVYVSVHENSDHTTPDNLTQSYIVTDLQNKINILWSFLKNHKKKKILVFMQSCKQVKYIYEIFCRLRPGLSVLALYGTLHQLKRMAIYDQFCGKESAVLFATDIAARGLDFPAVDWVVQLDCPEDGVTYVHRAGRTARYNTAGESLLVLLPQEEEGMLKQLNAHKIPISKIEINPAKLQQIEKKMAAHLASDKNLKESAQRAFQSYIKSVYLMKNKNIFNVHKLETEKFAESLGLAAPPRVRFLDKQKKIIEARKKKDVKEVAKDEEEDDESVEMENIKNASEKIQLTADADSDAESDEDIFTVKRTNVQIEDDVEEDAEVDRFNKNRITSKVQMAKRMLKKNIIPNSKVLFDDEGDVKTDSAKMKVSEEGRLYEAETLDREGGGIDIERAKEVLKAEDKFDKQAERARHKEMRKEKKRKEKEARKRKREEEDEEEEGESDSGESVDLSWLPDPDKIYGKEGGEESEKEEEEEEESEGETEVKEKADKITVIKKRIPKKAKLEEENVALDTGLSLEDDEDLALQLLSR